MHMDEKVRKVICDLSELLCKYDKDGIELEFLNKEEASKTHLKVCIPITR
jgi:hypothetical protein